MVEYEKGESYPYTFPCVPFLVPRTSQGMEPVRYQIGLGDSNKIHLQYNIVDRYNNLWTRLMQLSVTFAIPLQKFYFWLIIHPSVVMIDLSTTELKISFRNICINLLKIDLGTHISRNSSFKRYHK